MKKIPYKLFFAPLFLTAAATEAKANYTYTAPNPTLAENSLYGITEITKEEYDALAGNDEVFADAYVAEKDTVQYHYYQYREKPDIISSKPVTSGNGGQDISGGWYAQFGSYDGRAVNLRSGELGNIRADFVNNAVNGSGGYGGAAYLQDSVINSFTGDFINNHVNGSSGNAYGGAIYNNRNGIITEGISGNFINNYISGNRYVLGGGLLNGSQISSITGKFIGNYISAGSSAYSAAGGAIYNANMNGGTVNIGSITADFIYNHIISGTKGTGGAIANNETIESISGNFIGNYISATQKEAKGGAIYNAGTINSISGNFIGNYAQTTSTAQQAQGGAIFTEKNLSFVNKGENWFFSNNYTADQRGKIYNAIFVDTTSGSKDISFAMSNHATYVINDSVSGAVLTNYSVIKDYSNRYNLLFKSDDKTGTVFLADQIINADISLDNTTINLVQYNHADGVITSGGFGSDDTARSSLSLNNTVLGMHNNYYDRLQIKNYSAAGNTMLHLNIGQENGLWTSDVLNISGNISGQTNVIVYALSAANNLNASVVFASAPNDTVKNADAFKVYRVYGSPYMWTAVRNAKGETEGSTWYLVGNSKTNPNTTLPAAPNAPELIPTLPDPEPEPQPEQKPEPNPKPTLPEPNYESAPEILTYAGLHTASVEQTRSIANNIKAKTAANKFFVGSCQGSYDEAYNGQPLKNIWTAPVFHTAVIDRPIEMDADIYGLEAGFDLQSDVYNQFGVFASYRRGSYDANGNGSRLYSSIGSQIDINSYSGGLYYRHDYRQLQIFATAYAGLQKADLKTDDGIRTDTDGTELGGNISLGYTAALNRTTVLQPEIGISYIQTDFDNIYDNVGKSARYDTIRHTELETGLKLEKYLPTDNGIAKIYIKPSVVQTFTSGDNLYVSGQSDIKTYHDTMFGRLEAGGRYAVNEKVSLHGFAAYSFSSAYRAGSFGISLNYAW